MKTSHFFLCNYTIESCSNTPPPSPPVSHTHQMFRLIHGFSVTFLSPLFSPTGSSLLLLLRKLLDLLQDPSSHSDISKGISCHFNANETALFSFL